MKRISVAGLSLLLFVLASTVGADYHVVQRAAYGSKRKEEDKATSMMMQVLVRKLIPESEYWLSTDRAVLIVKGPETEGYKATVVDLVAGTCTLLASRTKRYATTTLPFDPAAVYTDAVLGLVRSRQSVRLTPNDLRRRLQGVPCVGYSVGAGGPDDWAVQGALWVTEALRLDAQKLESMLATFRAANVGASLALPNSDLRGFPMGIEIDAPSMTLTIETSKIEEKPLPEKLLTPPHDYIRVDKLDVNDVIDKNDAMMKRILGAE